MRLDLQPQAGVGEAGDRPLRFRPPEDRKVPRRPVLDLPDVGIVLVTHAQQHEVPAVARGKSGDLDVVTQQRRRGGDLVVLALEELALVIVARSPVQHRADAERFAEDLAHHVLGPHALGRALVVAAAGGVDVMVAGIPSVRGRVDPAPQPEVERARSRRSRRW